MNLIIVLTVSAIIGGLLGALIFFEPKEPYKIQVVIASTIRNTLVGLLIGFSLNIKSSWLIGVGYGLVYGLLSGLMVFFAQGGFKSKDAPYFIILGTTITGGLTGLILVNFAF
jgi:hypothetical protein